LSNQVFAWTGDEQYITAQNTVSGTITDGGNIIGEPDDLVTLIGNNSAGVIRVQLGATAAPAGRIFTMTWQSGDNNASSVTMRRSTDGVNWTTVPGTFTTVTPHNELQEIDFTLAGAANWLEITRSANRPRIDAIGFQVFGCVSRVPILSNDAYEILEDLPGVFNVLANDRDPANTTMTLKRIVGGPSRGVASVNLNNTLSYVSNYDVSGIDTITYEVCNTEGYCSTAQVFMTIREDSCLTPGQYKAITVGAPTVVTLNPTMDAEIRSSAATTNYGTATTAADIGRRDVRRFVLRFAADTLPANAIIDTATLTLVRTGGRAAAGNYEIRRLTERWLETPAANGVTWNRRVGTPDTLWTTAGGTLAATVFSTLTITDVAPAAKVFTGLEGLVSQWTTKAVPNFGLVVRQTNTTVDARHTFGTRENGTAGNRPVLRIVYRLPAPCTTIPNRAPFAQNDFATVRSDDSVWVKPLVNDIDPDPSAVRTLTTIISTTNATATISGDSIKVKPSPLGFNGTAQVRYRVVDQFGLADTAIIYITSTNAPPAANADFRTDSSGNIITFNPKLNDTDPEGDTLSQPVITQQPLHGSATIIGNNIQYTPNAGYTGKDTLVYQLCETIFNPADCDPLILCDTAMVVYTILNRKPIVGNDNIVLLPCASTVINILDNDVDPEGGNLTVTITRNPTKGTFVLGADKQITYTPNVGATGFDTIRYVLTDNGVTPLNSDTALVRINILAPTNTPPTAVNDFDEVNIGEPWYSSVLDNDFDDQNDPLTVSRPIGILNPIKGVANVLPNGLIEYNPFPGAFGLDSLDYIICETTFNYATCVTTAGGCDTARLFLNMLVVNTTIAINDQQSTWKNLPVSGDVSTNDYDPEGNIQYFNAFLNQADGVTPISSGATLSGVDTAGNPVANAGTITFNSSGQYTYTPANNFVGYISVEYFICDDSIIQACDTATLTITVNPYTNIENSVIATNDEYVTLNQNPITNKNILVNDADPQGDNFVVTAYRYDSDGDGVPDTSGVLGDTIIVGGVSSTNLPTDSAGKYILYPDGSFTFIPIKFFTGTVDMSYDICDSGVPVACATAPIRIHVTTDANGPFNDPPFAGDDLIYTNVNQPVLGNFFANDSDPNNDSVRVAGFTINTSGPATPIDTLTTAEGGTVIFYKNGTYLYTPPVGFIGSDKVVYEICDKTVINPQPLCATATIYQLVGAPNRTYAINDEHSTYSGVAVGGNVVNNDYDPEAHDINFGNFLNQNTGVPIASGATLSGINLQGNPVAAAGQITFDANGNYTFTPATDFVGKVTVPYSICDEGYPVSCDTAVLTIVVASPADICKNCLVANNDEYLTFGTAVTDNLTRNDADPNFNNFAVTTYQYDSNGDGILDATGSLATPTNIGGVNMYGDAVSNAGSFVLNSSGVFTFTPAAGFYGEVKVQYTICDDFVPALCVNATWQTNVIVDGDNSFNNPPQANDDFEFTYTNTPVAGNFVANDVDPNGHPISLNGFTINTGGPLTPIDTLTTFQNGTVVFFQNGTYSYTPPSNYIGPDQVNYSICDVTALAPQPLCATAMIHFLTGLENTTVASHDENTTFVNLPASGNVIDNDYDPEGNDKVFKGFTNNGTPIISGNTVSGIDRNGNPVANAGTLTFDTLGNYTYTPAAGFTGSISVPYGMCDDGSPIACDSALLQIQVLPLATDSNSIIANNDEYFGLRDQNISSQLFVNDADPQFEAFSLTSFRYDSDGDGIKDATGTIGSPVNVAGITFGGAPFVNAGQLTVNADGTFTFDPDSNFTGELRYDYTICDVGTPQACATALVRIHIVADINGPLNNPPYPADDFAYTSMNTPVTGNFIGNDYDPNGDSITMNGVIINVSGPANLIQTVPTAEGGTVAFYSNGTFLYTPPTGYIGPDRLTYTICDTTTVQPQPLCEPAFIHLLVSQIQDNTTVAINDEQSTFSSTPVNGNVVTNDYDNEDHVQNFGSFLDSNGNSISSGATVPGVTYGGSPVANAGTITFDGNGNYVFTPADGFTGTVSIPYSICDEGYPTACDTAVLTVTVNPFPTQANGIIANNDEYISYGTPVNGNVKLNDADPDGDAFSVTQYAYDTNGDGTADATTAPGTPQVVAGIDEDGNPVLNAGTLTLNSNGTFTFVPQSGFSGQVQVVYTACDVIIPPACAPAVLQIDVIIDNNGALNNPPIAGDDFSYTSANTPVTGNFISNDSDPNGDSLSVNGFAINPAGPATPIDTLTTAEGGTLVFLSNGTYLYTPPTGYVGPDQLTYTVCDVTNVDPQPLCASATIHLLVGSVNTTIATNDENSTYSGLTVGGNVTLNDYDAEGHTQTFGSFLNQADSTVATSPMILSGFNLAGNFVANTGTLTFDANGNYTFVPNADFVGKSTVPYTICDNGYPVVCDTAVLTIVTASPPALCQNCLVANNDEYITFGATVNGNITLNDADPNLNAYTVSSYLFDNNGDGIPDASGTVGSPVAIGGVNVFGNPVANAGTITIDSNGIFTFVPQSGFNGQVDLQYTICDNAPVPLCVNAQVTIHVVADPDGATYNNPPYAGDDFVFTFQDIPAAGSFVANDNDPNGNPISLNGTTINTAGPATPIDTLTTVEGGQVIFRANGTYTYTPPFGHVGPDRVIYTICDVTVVEPQPLCAEAMIHMLVSVPNNTIANLDENTTFNDLPVSGNVITNDYDPETDDQIFGSFLSQADSSDINTGATLSGYDADSNFVANAGTLTFDASGNYTFTPAAGFTGSVSVPYSVCDDGFPTACDTTLLQIQVLPQPFDANSIIANNDEYTTFGTPVAGNVKLNDADPQGNPFNVTGYTYDSDGDGLQDAVGTLSTPIVVGGFTESGTPISNAGTLVLNPDGTFIFTPAPGFKGQLDVFYTVCDNQSPQACATAILNIDVLSDGNGPSNDPPQAGDDFSYTSINTPVSGNFIANDSDLNNDSLSVNGITIRPAGPATPVDTLTTAAGGTVVIRANGTYNYTPPTGFTGPDRVEYTICDVTNIQPQPLCASAMIHLLVGTENTTNAVNDENSTFAGVPAEGNVTTNDFDIEGHTQDFGSFLNPTQTGNITSGSTVSGTDLNGNPVGTAGTLNFDGNGNYTFIPAPGFTGVATIPYSICDDGYPTKCDTAILEITVTPQPFDANSVIANNDEYFTFGDPVSSDLFVNDADPGGRQLRCGQL
jgi:large repetitive protein